MRTLSITASLLAAALISIPAAARPSNPDARPIPAQQQAKQGQQGQQGQRGAAALRRVGVDEARIKKIEAIHQKYAEERSKVREQAKPHREQLRSLIAEDSSDESAYRKALDGLERAKAKMDDLRDAERAEIAKVLKPSEQAKLLAAKRRGPRGAGERADGPRGPRDGADGPRGPRDGADGPPRVRNGRADGPRPPRDGARAPRNPPNERVQAPRNHRGSI